MINDENDVPKREWPKVCFRASPTEVEQLAQWAAGNNLTQDEMLRKAVYAYIGKEDGLYLSDEEEAFVRELLDLMRAAGKKKGAAFRGHKDVALKVVRGMLTS
jgi:uncharacterized Ntn-hydrolase superfamily protein